MNKCRIFHGCLPHTALFDRKNLIQITHSNERANRGSSIKIRIIYSISIC
jgi:hypothetical protein